MSRTRTSKREIDFGWWDEPDGRRSRLTWSENGRHLVLFNATGHSESLGAGISEHEVRAFVDELEAATEAEGGARLADLVRRMAEERWAF